MKHVIIGSGQIGTALVRTFARKNVEVLISTKVINGESGPPKAVIAHFW